MEYLLTPLSAALVVSTTIFALYMAFLLTDVYLVSVTRYGLYDQSAGSYRSSAVLGIVLGSGFLTWSLVLGLADTDYSSEYVPLALLVYGGLHYAFAFVALFIMRKVREFRLEERRRIEETRALIED